MSTARNRRRVEKRLSRKRIEHALAHRSCGGCTECCTALGVTELGKPQWQPCPHATPDGCAIYADRPASCRQYNCTWRAGFAYTKERPDEVGIVVDVGVPNADVGVTSMLVWRATQAGAAERSAGLRQQLAAKGILCILIAQDGLRIITGPPDVIAKVQTCNEVSKP